jgi:hypothetical protein
MDIVDNDLIEQNFILRGIQKHGPGDSATATSVKKRSYHQRTFTGHRYWEQLLGEGEHAQKRHAHISADRRRPIS